MMSFPNDRLLRKFALILTAAITALDVLYAVPVNGKYRSLGRDEYAEAHRGVVRVAGPTAPVFAAPLLITNLLLLRRVRHENGFGWILTSLLCLLTNAGITFAVNVPINNEFAKEETPEGWRSLRDQWRTAHNVRSLVQVTGLIVLVICHVKARKDEMERN